MRLLKDGVDVKKWNMKLVHDHCGATIEFVANDIKFRTFSKRNNDVRSGVGWEYFIECPFCQRKIILQSTEPGRGLIVNAIPGIVLSYARNGELAER